MPSAVWTVDFYFDFVSPYAYFAWLHARPRCAGAGVRLVPRPVLLAGLLAHHGHLGPAEIPAKRAYLLRDTLRYAGRHRIPFEMPRPHPFNPLAALRLSVPEVAGAHQERIIDALWRAGWAEGQDLADPDRLRAILDAAGLDGAALVEAAGSSEAKEALRRHTGDAIARGVFGVPSFHVDGELFWGNDRVDDLCEYLAGDDPLDRPKLAELMARPPGVQRTRRG
jgi:2-hydroxychromene-2-carboxylate isomerase